MEDWWIYKGDGESDHERIRGLPAPPPWRVFDGGPVVDLPPYDADSHQTDIRRAEPYRPREHDLKLVNAALYLRRPLLVTGKPGTGKSSLSYAVAHELGLTPVLKWSITSKSNIEQGLYDYDAIGRLRETTLNSQLGNTEDIDIGKYITLGPLGTALLPHDLPRVLLIDEIDKSDIDLPNDLLNIFEDGYFTIRELERLAATQPEVEVQTADGTKVTIRNGRIQCRQFPFIVLTSNGEREFPPAFLRRCLRLDMREPTFAELEDIVTAHLGAETQDASRDLIQTFLARRESGTLATDQLLNAIYLTTEANVSRERDELVELVLRYIDSEVELD